MLFQFVYGIAFVLTTIEGSEHGVYFQIKENSLFWFQWGKSCLVWKSWLFAFLLCFEWAGNFLQTSKLFRKPKTLSPSSRRNVNKFSSWASLPARWFYIFNKGICQWWQVAQCFAIKRKGRIKIPFLDCFTIFSTRRQFICFTRLLKKRICREILSTYVISSRVPICIGLCS